VPVILAHEHTWSYEGQPLRRFLDRELVGRFADRFLAVSREDRRRMIDIEGVKPAKAFFMPIGIPKPPPVTGRDVRAELGITAGALVLGTVCALRPQKALDVLVRAAAELVEEFPDVQVLIAGSGEDAERLHALVAKLGLERTVRLLGFWAPDDVPDLLAALDVAINSSDFEGSPLGVMEFMAAAKPVVATSVGGTPDLIDDGVEGFLVPRRDHRALAQATAKLLRDPELRARMGEQGRERQAREFDLDGMVRRLEDIYVELYMRKRRTR
jgi:glycosyltransferase involved in cell wall biosynthesis